MRHLTITLIALSALAATGHAEDRPGPTSREAKNLQQIIADIRTAPDLNSAAADYAEGRNITRTSADLYEAYMIRALQLGRARIALYPAMELVRLRDDHALAWATVAYNRASQGRNLDALQAVVRAMTGRANDLSVQHNAANLVAWYQQSDPRPQLPPDVVKIIDQSLPAWQQLPQFAQTSRDIALAFTGKARQAQQLEDQLGQAERTARSLENEARALDDAFRRNERTIQDTWKDVRRLRWYLNDTEAEIRRTTDANELRRLHSRARRVRHDLTNALREIQDRQDENDDLAARARQIRDTRIRVAGDIKKLQNDIRAIGGVAPAFTWHPPNVAKAAQPAAGNPPKDPPPGIAKPAQDQRMLRMALLLLDNGFEDKAAETLKEIARKYPNTNSAKQAQAILKQLAPGEPPRP